MKKTVTPRFYHMPDWVVPRDVAERLAEEDCREEALRLYMRLEKTTKFVVTGTIIETRGFHDEKPHWCWRHLKKCRVVGLGWTIEEEPTLEAIERDRAEAQIA